jgi:hypothetical protein
MSRAGGRQPERVSNFDAALLAAASDSPEQTRRCHPPRPEDSRVGILARRIEQRQQGDRHPQCFASAGHSSAIRLRAVGSFRACRAPAIQLPMVPVTSSGGSHEQSPIQPVGQRCRIRLSRAYAGIFRPNGNWQGRGRIRNGRWRWLGRTHVAVPSATGTGSQKSVPALTR